jgi:type IV pilus assembly protein PilE
MRQNTQNGFTLVELLIALAIIGILAGIAYPLYQDSMTKSRRADAKSALLELSVFMERLYTTTGCYNPGVDKDCTPPNGDAAAPILPFTMTPKSGKANYNLTVDVTTPVALVNGVSSSFTLTATPRKSDGTNFTSSDTNNPDKLCFALTLDNRGAKAASTGAADCW